MESKENTEYISELKKKLGENLTIVAHHYQPQSIVSLAELVGDSYKLAVDCSNLTSEFIVFCGVKFMAEGAKILAKDYQKVILPDLTAGCPLADKINEKTAYDVYKKITEKSENKIVPVVYINSSLDMKIFCGKHEGSTCTSSNASKIIKYYMDRSISVFFSPDYNLGINTANYLKISPYNIIKIDSETFMEKGYDLNKAQLFLWNGFCYVHKEFTTSDINHLRKKFNDIKIIVHPECDEEVVNLSDFSGSTQKIYDMIKNSPSNSIWGVGTEATFVLRIAEEFPDKTIVPLRNSFCYDMNKITLNKLSNSIKSIIDYQSGENELKFEIKIPEQDKIYAKKALEQMIKITGS